MNTKATMLATLACLAGTAPGDDVAALESSLRSDILDIVDRVNPVDPATGARTFVSFAFITDFHKCKRVEGDDAAANPDKTYWYGSAGVLTESEQSIRLLGSLAAGAGLDAVIAGGDFATAPIVGDGTRSGLTEEEYTNEIWNVKAMFDRHLPAGVPLFAIDGNHERAYTAGGANMQMSDEAWAYVLTNFNTSASAALAHGVGVTYHRDLPSARLGSDLTGSFSGNSYHLDLRRLVASGGPNVRIACVSMYDGAEGANPAYRAYDAAQFYDASGALLDAALTPENTVIGMVAHGSEERLAGTMARSAAGTLMNGFLNGWSNPASRTDPWNLGAHGGRAFLGLVAGHLHFTDTKEIADAYDDKVNGGNTVRASAISVASAYGVNYPAKPNQHELGTEAAYHFSIFVVDTDSNKLREIRLGGWSTNPVTHESPVVQLHDFNLRTHLEPSSGPVLGPVTVDPGVTNATISGTISSLGTGATACDVYLACGADAQTRPAPAKIAEGVTGSFRYVASNLTASTTYYYTLSVSNNAETAMGAARSGSFTTADASVEPGVAPVLGAVTVAPGITNATIAGAIESLGTDATACDVFLAWGTDPESLPPPTRIAEGATTSFSATISGLEPETFYYYALSVSNNAATPLGATAGGSFATKAAPAEPGDAILPGEDPATTRQAIQDAIDAAAPTSGTVALGDGLFEIDAQLWVTNGVTLVGRGWTNTVLRYAGQKGSDARVAILSGGATVGHATLTGGLVDGNDKSGGGALVTEGTITWCCVSNNVAIRSEGGGGIFVYRESEGPARVRIDHTIVADNAAGTNFLAGVGGGIGIRGRNGLQVEIESCLVHGNVSGKAGAALASHGGGIAVVGVSSEDAFTTAIRNTTVADNRAVGSAARGGGLYADQADTTLVNCLFSGNAAEAGDGNVAFSDAAVAAAVAERASSCLFADGTAVFGANPVGLDGAVAFADAAAGDYHLADGSLVADKGTDYAGIGTDLDGRPYAWPPAIGCYEYGSGVRPPDEWDLPGPNGGGGIKGFEGEDGRVYIVFTSIARGEGDVAVGFAAAKIGAAVGDAFALVCKADLAAAETFTLPGTLTAVDAEAALATLTAATDRDRLFAVGLAAAEE